MKATILFLCFALSFNSYAQTKTDNLSLEYPELVVAPSASKRLEMELANDRKAGIERQLPIQLSAITTLAIAGYIGTLDMSTKGDYDQKITQFSSLIGTTVGVTWLGLSFWMNGSYKPYDAGMKSISTMPKGTQSEILARERIAEEALFRAGDFANKIKWFSVYTNLTAALMFTSVSDQNAKIGGLVAGILAFTPVIFPHSYETASEIHKEYKKKIYGPLTGFTIIPTKEGEAIPALSFAYNF